MKTQATIKLQMHRMRSMHRP